MPEPQRTQVIGEVALSHDGSLGLAHAYIDVIARCGADAVKFQTHIASAESTTREQFRVQFSRQDATRYDYWQRTSFTPEQWAGLAQHANERNIAFLSTPFSLEACELLERIGVSAWKVGSGEVSNIPMLQYMAMTGRPIWLSSGMSSWQELDRSVAAIRQHTTDLVVFQCTTAYPCPPELTGLNVIADIRNRFKCPVGLSDHSGTIYPGLAAVALGATHLELHVTMSRDMFGPDVPASVTTNEFTKLIEGVRFLEKALASPVDKDGFAESAAPLRKLFSKSLVAARRLRKGEILTASDVAFKKPGDGIPAGDIDQFIGRKLLADLEPNDALMPHHIAQHE